MRTSLEIEGGSRYEMCTVTLRLVEVKVEIISYRWCILSGASGWIRE